MTEATVRPRLAVEVAGLATAWFAYRWGRYAVRDQVAEAVDNAGEVLAAEAALGLAVEKEIQDAVLSRPSLLEVLNHYYVYAHVAVTVAVLCGLWWAAPATYRRTRRVLVVSTLLGLAIHAAYPLAPPRLLPGTDMVDTLARFGPRVYSDDHLDSVVNQFAAMPSFHVGWAALAAAAVITASRSRWRWVALAHPASMGLAVVSTANHYVLDAVAGVAVVGAVGAADVALGRTVDRRRVRPREPARGTGVRSDRPGSHRACTPHRLASVRRPSGWHRPGENP